NPPPQEQVQQEQGSPEGEHPGVAVLGPGVVEDRHATQDVAEAHDQPGDVEPEEVEEHHRPVAGEQLRATAQLAAGKVTQDQPGDAADQDEQNPHGPPSPAEVPMRHLPLLALPLLFAGLVLAQEKPAPLTPKEAAGWLQLFDGESTFGWHIDPAGKV